MGPEAPHGDPKGPTDHTSYCCTPHMYSGNMPTLNPDSPTLAPTHVVEVIIAVRASRSLWNHPFLLNGKRKQPYLPGEIQVPRQHQTGESFPTSPLSFPEGPMQRTGRGQAGLSVWDHPRLARAVIPKAGAPDAVSLLEDLRLVIDPSVLFLICHA